MPREYKTTPGPASPSPASFGAADINLQTPRFVAQTAVAAPENPFEALQKILGIGADIGSQMLRMQTAEIEGKINYDRAVEAKQERAEVKARREASDEAARFMAEQKMRLAKAKTPEEAKAIEEELKSDKGPESVEMMSARAAIVEGAESEARQMQAELDREQTKKKEDLLNTARAFNTEYLGRIESAVEAGSVEQLTALRDNAILEYEQETNPEKRAVLQSLRAIANNEIEKLKTTIEADNTKRENAAVTASRTLWMEASLPVVDALNADIPALEKRLENVTDDSLRRTLIDTVRDEVLRARPEMMKIMAEASQAENDAASTAINQAVDSVVKTVVGRRNARNYQEAMDVKIGDYTKRAEENIAVLDEIATDLDLPVPQQKIALRDATVSYVNGGDSAVDSMRRAYSLLGHQESAVQVAANSAMKKLVEDVTRGLQEERQNIIQTTPSTGDLDAAGWNTRFRTKDEFLNWFLDRVGTDRGAFEANLDIQHVLGPTMAALGEEFDQDTARTERNIRSLEARARAATRDGRSATKVEDIWKYSPLHQAFEDGSYVDLAPSQMYAMMYESLVGYADVAVPASLAKVVIDGADNPQNFAAVQQFWRIMNRSVDPTARNAMLSNDKYQTSYAIAAALDFMNFNPENTGPVIQSVVTSFASNLKAYKEPEKDSVEGRAKRNEINGAISTLAQGAGLDMSRITDVSGVEVKEVMGLMSPTDREIMYQFATMAANYPDTGSQGGFMAELMAKNGYRIYPHTVQGAPKFSLVQNVPGRLGTTPLPEPAMLETREWAAYLESKKPAIARDLSSRRQLDNAGTPIAFSPDKLGTVEVVMYDQDTRDGFATVRVWETNRWINIDSVRLTKEDFESFAKTYKPPEQFPRQTYIRPKF